MQNRYFDKFSQFVNADWVQKIINSEEFYFQMAKDAFRDFDNYRTEDKDEYKRLHALDYKEIVDIRENKREGYDIIEKIDILVAYCDNKAFNKQDLNQYSDKRVLARAGIRQNAWIKQLLTYKISPDQIRESIFNVITYLKNPQEDINMISPNHRSMVATMMMETKFNSSSFVKNVKEYFVDRNLILKNENNRTLLYNFFFYENQNEWCKIVEGLIGKDTRLDWKKEIIEMFQNGMKTVVVTWDNRPGSYTELAPQLLKELKDRGFFYFYYIANNEATHKCRVIDFIEKENYSSKAELWNTNNVGWYNREISDYGNISLLFLIDSFQQLDEPIPQDDFYYYKNGNPPGRKNIVAYSAINIINSIEEIEHNTIKELNEIKDILLQKKQIILQGAPGTGKTYNTAAIALAVLGIPFDHSSHEDVMVKYEKQCKNGIIHFTTFHQSMDYEDFIEGLKPKVVDGGIVYEVVDGLFKRICKTETYNNKIDQCSNPKKIDSDFDKYYSLLITKLNDVRRIRLSTLKEDTPFEISLNLSKNINIHSGSKIDAEGPSSSVTKEKLKENSSTDNNTSYITAIRDYMQSLTESQIIENIYSNTPKVLIIDEINRGNISKIFGELITLLEADKRISGDHSITVTLPYSKEEFSIPDNVYIIGTMNTTDRSVGYIDYAVRRRFAFYTLKSKSEAIEKYYFDINKELGDQAVALFGGIREFINKAKSPDLDVEDLMVGHSYFMAKDKDSLRLKLKYEIIPLLREYEKDGILNLSQEQKINIDDQWLIYLQ